jgi:hypothetical protein
LATYFNKRLSLFEGEKMAAIHETAYPRIKSNLSKKELTEIYTPTAVLSHTKPSAMRS